MKNDGVDRPAMFFVQCSSSSGCSASQGRPGPGHRHLLSVKAFRYLKRREPSLAPLHRPLPPSFTPSYSIILLECSYRVHSTLLNEYEYEYLTQCMSYI